MGNVGSNGRLKRRPRDQTAGTALGDLMRRTPGVALAAALAACTWLGPACASEPLHCGRFAQETLPSPIPQKGMHALDRAEEITRAVKSAAYVVLFFGDSLTEHWDSTVWAQSLAPRGALNAGVGGDRTDHLLWRLMNGNLEGLPPKAVVLLIGTNDLGFGRSPELAADGIRANLETLRHHLPETSILLLGLLPREESPTASLRAATTRVNQLVHDCADDQHIFFADIGDVLLDSDGRLTAAISPDRLHFTARGYSLLASRLDPELDRLLGAAR